MKLFRKLKALVLLFAVLALVLGFTVLNAPSTPAATECCLVMYCTVFPPFYCWEECRPCPTFP